VNDFGGIPYLGAGITGLSTKVISTPLFDFTDHFDRMDAAICPRLLPLPIEPMHWLH
jgi:hypothetical protein